jgi:KDO2-lipid IV(A) lauroyltransferase
LLKYAVFWFVFRVLGRLPLPALYTIAALVGDVSYLLSRQSRANVMDNLRHVLPDASGRKLRRLARRVFRNVAYYYADMAHLPHMHLQEFFERRLTFHGIEEHILATSRAGRGVVMITGHFGNPELALQGMVPLGARVFAVTERVQPAALSRMMDKIRSSKGVAFMPVGFAGAKRLVQTLKSGGIVALTGDRDIEGPRMLLPFFGQETLMPTGPVEIALRTGALIVPSFSARKEGYRIDATAEEPIEIERTKDFQADVRRAALAWIERFERRLRDDPGQWAVLESIWDEAEQPGKQAMNAEHESMRA